MGAYETAVDAEYQFVLTLCTIPRLYVAPSQSETYAAVQVTLLFRCACRTVRRAAQGR